MVLGKFLRVFHILDIKGLSCGRHKPCHIINGYIQPDFRKTLPVEIFGEQLKLGFIQGKPRRLFTIKQ